MCVNAPNKAGGLCKLGFASLNKHILGDRHEKLEETRAREECSGAGERAGGVAVVIVLDR
jgi:hypothetical protein